MGLLNRRSGSEAGTTAEKEMTIINRLGLHARPAAMFVRVASRHRCDIWVAKGDEEINGKSIMGLMMLAAGPGTKLLVTCEGADCHAAMDAIEELMKRKFDET